MFSFTEMYLTCAHCSAFTKLKPGWFVALVFFLKREIQFKSVCVCNFLVAPQQPLSSNHRKCRGSYQDTVTNTNTHPHFHTCKKWWGANKRVKSSMSEGEATVLRSVSLVFSLSLLPVHCSLFSIMCEKPACFYATMSHSFHLFLSFFFIWFCVSVWSICHSLANLKKSAVHSL